MDITLALGGGGAKGNAHIGALRRLEKEGFRVRAIAGTSFGGLAAVFYAAGYTPNEIEETFAAVDQSHLYSRSSEGRPSLLGLAGVRKWLDRTLGERTFDDLAIPCVLTAVDLNCGCEVTLDEGRVRDAILATIAVPGIFPAFPWHEWELVDGGVLNPVPVSVARALAPSLPVVAVTLQAPMGEPAHSMTVPLPIPSGLPKPILDRLAHIRYAQAFDIFMRSVDVGNRAIAEYRLAVDKPDVIIRPAVSDIELLGKVDVREVARRGEEAVVAALPELKRAVSWSHRLRRTLFGGNP
ncbi:MAG: patatin-like phospholipase family protein [Chloroflexota bacterium]